MTDRFLEVKYENLEGIPGRWVIEAKDEGMLGRHREVGQVGRFDTKEEAKEEGRRLMDENPETYMQMNIYTKDGSMQKEEYNEEHPTIKERFHGPQ